MLRSSTSVSLIGSIGRQQAHRPHPVLRYGLQRELREHLVEHPTAQLHASVALLHRTLVHGSREVERSLCAHHPRHMVGILHVMLEQTHAVLVHERGDQRSSLGDTADTLPELVELRHR